VNNNLVCVKKI